jgi:type VI secretion system protein ImpA
MLLRVMRVQLGCVPVLCQELPKGSSAMAADVERLLAAVSDDSPCGEDLSYDAGYAALDRAIQGTPEQQVGDSIVPAQDPDWREIKTSCLDLWGRSHDLRLALDLTLTFMMLEGLGGLRDGLKLLHGLIERHWDSFWPKLDPEDNNDPLERLNIISSLAPESSYQDPLRLPQRILDVPLAVAPQLGKFTLRHVLLASGELSPVKGEKVPETAHIDGAFASGDKEHLERSAAAAAAADELLGKIEAALGEKVGAANVPSLDKLHSRVKQIRALYAQKAGGGAAMAAADGGAVGAVTGAAPAAVARGPGISGGIASREDVIKALDMICQFYERTEPASPVPLLLQRARRLVTMSFLEIIEDIAAEGLRQVKGLAGIKDD